MCERRKRAKTWTLEWAKKRKKRRKAGKEGSSQNFMHSAVFKTKVLSFQRESQALKHFQRTSKYETCFVTVQT